jgi:Protein of unknown function (DUF1236)
MSKHLLAAGVLLLAGTGLAAADTIVITPEQETVIHNYVVEQNVPAYAPTDGVEIGVGSTLPDTVELHTIDAPDIQPVYSYVMVDGRTVLVDPATRRIVKIID